MHITARTDYALRALLTLAAADVATGSSDPATGSSDPATGSSDPATGSSDPATGSSDPATGPSDATAGSSAPATGSSDVTAGSSDAASGGPAPAGLPTRAVRTTVTGQALAAEQDLPLKFLEAILADLRRAGVLRTRRGPVGGYALARPASEISVGEVVRAVDGPLAVIRGERPEQAEYTGAAEHLQALWIALRAAVRVVLDDVTLAELLSGDLPPRVRELVAEPGAWTSR